MKKNKTVVITGAGRGIGRGIALAFAEEKYNVVVSDISKEDIEKVTGEVKRLGADSLAVKCDVSKGSEVKNLMAEAVRKFKKIDVLINNAGIFPFVPFSQMTEGDWDKVINVNLKSIFLCSRAVLDFMPTGGRIINISSIASLVGFEGLVHYCASKGGINSLVRALALELAPKKITVNTIAPGAIETPGAMKTLTEEAKKQTIAVIPLARFGLPEDIANAALFLASEKSDYITGQIIIVDGGRTLR